MNQDEMAVKLTEVEGRSKSNTHRIDALEKSTEALNKLATAVEVMASEQQHQGETMAEIKTDVTALGQKVDVIEKKPAKRWETIAGQIIALVVAALVGAALAKLGL